MPYAVQHRYYFDKDKATGKYRKEATVLIAVKATVEEARHCIATAYADRFMSGRDWVEIVNEQGVVIERTGVDYMAQFEALPGKVWEFPSSSNPKKKYKTQINTTGILSCNCTAWAMGWKKMTHPLAPTPYRHCGHTDTIVRQEKLKVEINGQYLFLLNESLLKAKQKFGTSDLSKATGPQAKFALLIKDYEEAIATMAALDPNQMYQAAAAVEMAKFRVESYMILLEEHGIDGNPAFMAAEARLNAVKQEALNG
jgi:hypothetical protein